MKDGIQVEKGSKWQIPVCRNSCYASSGYTLSATCFPVEQGHVFRVLQGCRLHFELCLLNKETSFEAEQVPSGFRRKPFSGSLLFEKFTLYRKVFQKVSHINEAVDKMLILQNTCSLCE